MDIVMIAEKPSAALTYTDILTWSPTKELEFQ